MRFIIAQCFGFLGILIYLCCFHFKEMKTIRKAKMAMDVVYGTHYFLLGALSGFAVNAICFFREIVYINNDKPFFKSRIWFYVFMGVSLGSAILTWQSLYSILPALTACIGTYSFWQGKPQRARILALTNNVLMFTYDLFVLSYMGLVAESLAFVSVTVALVREYKKNKSPAKT